MDENTKVLAVKRPHIFLVHSSHDVPLDDWSDPKTSPRWSESVLRRVSSEYSTVIIFNNIIVSLGKGVWPEQSLDEKIKTLKLPNVLVVDYDPTDRLEAVNIWKRSIMNVGGYVKKSNNINGINCFSIPYLTKSDHIYWHTGSGSQHQDIFPEKIKSFMELASERELRSIW